MRFDHRYAVPAFEVDSKRSPTVTVVLASDDYLASSSKCLEEDIGTLRTPEFQSVDELGPYRGRSDPTRGHEERNEK